MRVILFGATGMVGQGVLRVCLLDSRVERVLSIGRNASGVRDAKFTEVVQRDLFSYSAVEDQLTGYDGCFFCLGISSAGMKEQDYERITYGVTMAAAQTLARLSPQMTFVYVSGQGTDSSERGSAMWARVKGRTENALLRLPFKGAYMFRPGFIEPLHGIQSRTRAYRVLYAVIVPLMPLLRRIFAKSILTTDDIGKAMIKVAQDGAPKKILEVRDIMALSRSAG